MEELKWISEIKDIAFSSILLAIIFYAVKTFFEKYPTWRAEDQKAKDARAAGYQKSMEGLTVQVADVCKTSAEGTRVILESLGKAADKQQIRHEAVMGCLGGILQQPREISGRAGA